MNTFLGCGAIFSEMQDSAEDERGVELFTDEDGEVKVFIDNSYIPSFNDTNEYSDYDLSNCLDTTIQEDIMKYSDFIQALGSEIIIPTLYSDDINGFQQYIEANNIKYFTSHEISKIGNQEKFNECSNRNDPIILKNPKLIITKDSLMPPKECWIRTAAIMLLADNIRKKLKQRLYVSSYWRPTCYNSKVSGAKYSDHIQARSLDLSFKTTKLRHEAQQYICDYYWKNKSDQFFSIFNHSDKLNISIGLGNTYMHLGLASRNGRRYWIYKSFYENNKTPQNCWKY